MKVRQIEIGYLVRLEKGEEIIESLTALAERLGIKGGWIHGLGALTDVELGYYDIEQGNYVPKGLAGDFELGNLVGNISWLEGKPFVHAHVVVGGPDLSALTGHLISGTISVTGEFIIVALKERIVREFHEALSSNLLRL